MLMSAGRWLRNRFLAGLLIVVPLVVTILALTFLFRQLDGLLAPVFEKLLHRPVPGLGLLATLLLVLLAGIFASLVLGRQILEVAEAFLARLPIVRSVYRTAKEVVAAVTLPENQLFREFVMIEYPRKGSWAYGFVTSYARSQDSNRRGRTAHVFVPHTPVPTTGVVIVVPEDELIHLDVSREDAIKLIVSAGLVIPPQMAEPAHGAQAPGEDAGRPEPRERI
jgi:uncharacterized membrane protein